MEVTKTQEMLRWLRLIKVILIVTIEHKLMQKNELNSMSF
jgi:hypothetical protein